MRIAPYKDKWTLQMWLTKNKHKNTCAGISDRLNYILLKNQSALMFSAVVLAYI